MARSATVPLRALLRPTRPPRRISLGAAALAIPLILAACDSPVVDTATLSANPFPAGSSQRLVAHVRMDVDPTTGTANATVIPVGVRSAAPELPDGFATEVSAAALQNVNYGFVQNGKVLCGGCNNGTAGLHTVSIPLKAIGIFKDLEVSNLRCTNCKAPPTHTGITTEVVPGDAFTVGTIVDVDKVTQFTVYFDLVGTPVTVADCLRQVGFKDDHAISLDGAATITDPVWLDANCNDITEEREPVAYTSGAKMAVQGASVQVTFTPQITKSVKMKFAAASTTAGYYMRFTFGTVTVPGTGGTVSLGDAIGDKALPTGRAVVLQPLRMKWSYQIVAKPGPPADFDASSHPVYVTFKPPLNTSDPLNFTVLDLSTRNGAGRKTEASVVQGIWGEFADRVVPKKLLIVTTGAVADGPVLSYYVDNTAGSCRTVVGLLNFPYDAQCDAWAKFLAEMLATQGIESDLLRIEPKPGEANAFLVKNWGFPRGAVSNPCSAAPWTFRFSHLTANPIPSQGNPSPAPVSGGWYFRFHYLVRYEGTYYDPSFGTTPRSSLAAWEAASVAGLMRLVGTDECLRTNPPEQNLMETEM